MQANANGSLFANFSVVMFPERNVAMLVESNGQNIFYKISAFPGRVKRRSVQSTFSPFANSKITQKSTAFAGQN